jgi:hypothetical protein
MESLTDNHIGTTNMRIYDVVTETLEINTPINERTAIHNETINNPNIT